ncbi:hypothetical protein BDV93DRAFT_524985 [Ceratobasidium sp. AG-I]|nr:hypothetical protein BDV93DRAFT_524985 [Ceratobasidium sp. AG-I]
MKESQETGPEKYTVVVGGRTFVLSRSQIERDSPNYFTSHFLSPSNQGLSTNTRLEILRDPDIFELVLRYLNGYHVVPIHDRLVPPKSTPETIVADLQADAEFYQLRGLIELCSPVLKTMEQSAPYAMIAGQLTVSKDGLSPAEPLEDIIPRFSVCYLNETGFKAATTTDMFKLTTKTAAIPNYLLVTSWSTHIMRAVLKKEPFVKNWELIGWKRKLEGDTRHAMIFVKLYR